MDDAPPKLKRHLKPTGMLWLAWPTGKKLGTDLALSLVMRIGYSHELLESTCLSLDATLTGFKFTHLKKDKIYNNSYGQLKPYILKQADETGFKKLRSLPKPKHPMRCKHTNTLAVHLRD